MISFSVQLFVVLLIAGLFLIGAEIFVPGGILGAMGGLALLVAMISAFVAFPPATAFIMALGVVIALGVAMVVWIKYFPKTNMGKKIMSNVDLADSKATEEGLDILKGKTGKAATDLRPGGFATIEGKRVDVVTRGEMIDRESLIEIIEVEGNRIVVKKTQ